MIIKLPICIEDKILFNNFLLEKSNDKIIIKNFNRNYENTIIKYKVPLCNNFEGISYIDLFFPLEIKIIDKKLITHIFLQKIFLSQNNLDIDFFLVLEKITIMEFKLDFIKKEDVISYEKKIWQYWVDYDDEVIVTYINYN